VGKQHKTQISNKPIRKFRVCSLNNCVLENWNTKIYRSSHSCKLHRIFLKKQKFQLVLRLILSEPVQCLRLYCSIRVVDTNMNVHLFSSSLSLPYMVLIFSNKFEEKYTHRFLCVGEFKKLCTESGLRVTQADSLITVESTRHSNQ